MLGQARVYQIEIECYSTTIFVRKRIIVHEVSLDGFSLCPHPTPDYYPRISLIDKDACNSDPDELYVPRMA